MLRMVNLFILAFCVLLCVASGDQDGQPTRTPEEPQSKTEAEEGKAEVVGDATGKAKKDYVAFDATTQAQMMAHGYESPSLQKQ